MNRRFTISPGVVVIALTLLSTVTSASAQDRSPVDVHPEGALHAAAVARGRDLAQRVVDATGGLEAWHDTSWDLAFDFVILHDDTVVARFSHQWDRASGHYVVSGTAPSGQSWSVEIDDIRSGLDGLSGATRIDGEPAPDSLHTRLLQMGYARFINDSYWLLEPIKLLDSGVHQLRLEDTTIDGRTLEVLSISFDQVGLTPGDRYLVYVDPDTGRIVRWHYFLQSGREGEFVWTDYQKVGPLTLALSKRSLDGSSEIRFENVRVMHQSSPLR